MKRKDPTELNAVHFNIQTYRIVKAVVQRSTFVRLVWFEELFDSVVLLTASLFCVFAVVHLLHSCSSRVPANEGRCPCSCDRESL